MDICYGSGNILTLERYFFSLLTPINSLDSLKPTGGFIVQFSSDTDDPESMQTSQVKGSVSQDSPHFRRHWQLPGSTYTLVCRPLFKGLPQPPLQGQPFSRVSHRTQRNTLFIIMGFFKLRINSEIAKWKMHRARY